MIDYKKVVSKRAYNMKPSGIRKFFDIAQTLEGVISLGVGEPDFATPWSIRREAITALEKGKTVYSANSGHLALRQSLAKYIKKNTGQSYDPDGEIIVTVGGSEAIDIAVRALIEPDDEALIVEPSFVCYKPIIELMGGTAITLETKIEDNFRLTAKALKEKITDKTKLLILPFPNNPTGATMRKQDLEEIAKVLEGTDIIIISDEIYSELTYEEKHTSIIEIDGMKERTIYINGFSKAFAMTGWRLGYLAAPKELAKHMLKIHQYAIMCSPTISQYAAIDAIENCGGEVKKMVKEYDLRRRFLVDRFNKLGLECFNPGGAFYVFPCIKSTGLSSQEFCSRLVQEKKVAVVPGDAFGDCGDGFIRVSYAYSINHLKEAMDRIEAFLKTL